MLELEGRYTIRSNRESGFGRYDVMLEASVKELRKDERNDAIIIEFKVYNPKECIRKYGFAFEGKMVLIG